MKGETSRVNKRRSTIPTCFNLESNLEDGPRLACNQTESDGVHLTRWDCEFYYVERVNGFTWKSTHSRLRDGLAWVHGAPPIHSILHHDGCRQDGVPSPLGIGVILQNLFSWNSLVLRGYGLNYLVLFHPPAGEVVLVLVCAVSSTRSLHLDVQGKEKRGLRAKNGNEKRAPPPGVRSLPTDLPDPNGREWRSPRRVPQLRKSRVSAQRPVYNVAAGIDTCVSERCGTGPHWRARASRNWPGVIARAHNSPAEWQNRKNGCRAHSARTPQNYVPGTVRYRNADAMCELRLETPLYAQRKPVRRAPNRTQ
ncbi:hypothetical protein C8F04DRAFT_1180367 [Mycena alexandri]|uniref:Uncharacterized protein n=1 Tax=Mycena alexandri TaxID=1745969 RepID=A0AAD6XA13_9AGAR|nr:hypothetical protein C8F04DRAFT_1180367 [Mycena alexandri]